MIETDHAEADLSILIDDQQWEELLILTDGAATVCYQCGVCTAVCPWGTVKEETVSVRTLMRQAQLGLPGAQDKIWLCTTCAQCELFCPRQVNICNVLRGLRYLAWERRQVPAGLPSVLWSIHWNNNPWTQPPSQRFLWAKEIDLPDFDPELHEWLLFVGCTSSYDRRAQQVVLALVRLLAAAGLSFGVLGDEEPCCGEAALALGQKPFFEEVAHKALESFRERGVSQLVTVSPHSYDAFRNHYQRMNGNKYEIQCLHYTQLLERLLRSGQLELKQSVMHQVTMHDPCYLARHNDDWQGSRTVLNAVPGLVLTEMEHTGQNTLCCGGGGGRMWLETNASERFADLRLREALDAGATIVATACPLCIACLEDSLKALKLEGLQVLDVAEIAALAL